MQIVESKLADAKRLPSGDQVIDLIVLLCAFSIVYLNLLIILAQITLFSYSVESLSIRSHILIDLSPLQDAKNYPVGCL